MKEKSRRHGSWAQFVFFPTLIKIVRETIFNLKLVFQCKLLKLCAFPL